jgi:imidazolonepropionase
MQLLISNIRQLVTVHSGGRPFKAGREMREIGVLEHASVLIENGEITWIGNASDFTNTLQPDADTLDGSSYVALPGFVDAHTHALFGGSREHEFALRSEGKTYQDIAAQGGGILSTVNATRAATKKELKKAASKRLDAMMKHGTTTVEIKSGYGLSEESEIKMLEAITELADEHFISIRSTFLGAHALPPEFKDRRAEYIDLLCNRMMPYIAKRKLAQFCDVFCEVGYFSVEESRKILKKPGHMGWLSSSTPMSSTPSAGHNWQLNFKQHRSITLSIFQMMQSLFSVKARPLRSSCRESRSSSGIPTPRHGNLSTLVFRWQSLPTSIQARACPSRCR